MLERTGRAESTYNRVDGLFRTLGPMTDFEALDAYIDKYGPLREGTDHTVATARLQLEEDGRIVPAGLQRPHPVSKVPCIVWKAANVAPPFRARPWAIVDVVAAMQVGDPLTPELWALAHRTIHAAEERKKLHKRKKVT